MPVFPEVIYRLILNMIGMDGLVPVGLGATSVADISSAFTASAAERPSFSAVYGMSSRLLRGRGVYSVSHYARANVGFTRTSTDVVASAAETKSCHVH